MLLRSLQGTIGKVLHKQLEYHVFDFPLSELTYEEKIEEMESVMLTETYKNFQYVKLVPYVLCQNEEDIKGHFVKCTKDQYEGTIVRNAKAVYKYNTRSNDVFKYKEPECEEFEILSWFTDKLNQPVFWCMSEGGEFKAKPKGTKEQREDIRQQADSWVGGYMTVEFEMFSKEGKPQKPIAIGLREGYVEDGVFIPTE